MRVENYKKILIKITLVFLFLVSLYSVEEQVNATTYKLGDKCIEVPEEEYPKGWWCSQPNLDAEPIFLEIPIQLDEDSVKLMLNEVKKADCSKTASRFDCEEIARDIAREFLIKEIKLTTSQSNNVLSCYLYDGFDTPPDFSNEGVYLEGPWENGAPRFCYWFKYPSQSAFQRFNSLDSSSKSSIFVFTFAGLILFYIFFGIFNNGKKDLQSISIRTGKTIISIVGIGMVIAFLSWLIVFIIQPLFSNTKIDLSKKVFGIPQYMIPVINGIYIIIWSLNRKGK